jgi:hypothetical protein
MKKILVILLIIFLSCSTKNNNEINNEFYKNYWSFLSNEKMSLEMRYKLLLNYMKKGDKESAKNEMYLICGKVETIKYSIKLIPMNLRSDNIKSLLSDLYSKNTDNLHELNDMINKPDILAMRNNKNISINLIDEILMNLGYLFENQKK